MPARRVPEWELAKRRELKEEYGGHMTIPDVQEMLGKGTDRRTAIDWLEGMEFQTIGSRQKRYDVNDIAYRLYMNRVNPA